MRVLLTILVGAALMCAARAANEISAQVVLKVEDGYISQQRAVNAQWTMNAARPNISAGTHIIPTNGAAVLITTGDVATNGWTFFRNLSAYNTISIGASVNAGTTVHEVLRLPAGTYALLPLGTSAVYAVMSAHTTNETSSVLEKLILDH